VVDRCCLAKQCCAFRFEDEVRCLCSADVECVGLNWGKRGELYECEACVIEPDEVGRYVDVRGDVDVEVDAFDVVEGVEIGSGAGGC